MLLLDLKKFTGDVNKQIMMSEQCILSAKSSNKNISSRNTKSPAWAIEKPKTEDKNEISMDELANTINEFQVQQNNIKPIWQQIKSNMEQVKMIDGKEDLVNFEFINKHLLQLETTNVSLLSL